MSTTSRIPARAPYVHAILVSLSSLVAAAATEAASFTFAGYTFEEDYTPDVISLLGNNANLGGAVMSAGTLDSTTQSTAFVAASNIAGVISPQPGFDPAQSLGRQANTQWGITQPDNTTCHYACAVNLPSTDNGGTARHGIQASWSGGAGLLNGAGNDFVVYESATGTTSPGNREAFMVRLDLGGGLFTSWRYEFADSAQQYLGQPDSATATAFDLSDFGVASDAVIFAIQVANMRPTDRVSDAGFGNVNFGGVGNLALSSAGGSAFAAGNFDPDPLYVGILGSVVVPVPAAAWLFMGAIGALGALRRKA